MSGHAVPRVYPFQPLEDYVGGGVQTIAKRMHMDVRNLAHIRNTGWLTDRQADRFAVALGVHPYRIWPTWFDDGLTWLDDRFVNGGGWRVDWDWKHREEAS